MKQTLAATAATGALLFFVSACSATPGPTPAVSTFAVPFTATMAPTSDSGATINHSVGGQLGGGSTPSATDRKASAVPAKSTAPGTAPAADNIACKLFDTALFQNLTDKPLVRSLPGESYVNMDAAESDLSKCTYVYDDGQGGLSFEIDVNDLSKARPAEAPGYLRPFGGNVQVSEDLTKFRDLDGASLSPEVIQGVPCVVVEGRYNCVIGQTMIFVAPQLSSVSSSQKLVASAVKKFLSL